MNQKWINEGGIFYPISGDFVLHATPGPGVWRAVQSPNPMDPRIGLQKITDRFEFDFKLYDLGQSQIIDHIQTLWNNEEYKRSGKNLGIVLNGTKGTGKTIISKILCNEMQLPVIVVSSTFKGAILPFIQNISYECVILLDEAEKVFAKDEGDDKVLLSLIDGVYNAARKLYILTTNTLNVNDNLIGRPGRIRYVKEFRNLPIPMVVEYAKDNLKDINMLDKVLQEVDLLEISTIDILKAIVEEINVFGEIKDVVSMNIPKARYIYEVARLSGCSKDDIDDINYFIDTLKPGNMPMAEWYNSFIPVANIPESILAKITDRSGFKEDIYELNLDEESKDKLSTGDQPTTELVVAEGGPSPKRPKAKLAGSVKQQAESPKSKNKDEEDDETPGTPVITICDLMRHVVPNCDWVGTYRMTSQLSELWREVDTSLGIVIDVPNKNGVFLLQDPYDKSEKVYIMLRQKNNPSLYRGRLLF